MRARARGLLWTTTDPLKGVETEPPDRHFVSCLRPGLRPRHKASPNSLFSQKQRSKTKAKQPYRFATCLRHNIQNSAMRPGRTEPTRQRVFGGWSRGVWLGHEKTPRRAFKSFLVGRSVDVPAVQLIFAFWIRHTEHRAIWLFLFFPPRLVALSECHQVVV